MRDSRIAARADRAVADWQELCRIPTIAKDTGAIAEAADWIEQKLSPLMDRVTRYQIPGYGPVLAGFRSGLSKKTLLIYNHYDVQPAGDLAKWTSPPFAAEIRDGKMFARGACDDKADVAGRLHALELWLAEVGDTPPYSIIYLADPCEETGSPGLDAVLAENASELAADACLWESYLREENGRPALGFGCRGSLEIELRLELLATHQHTSYAPVLRSAVLELIRAIASLSKADGSIAVPGFSAQQLLPDASARERTAELSLPEKSVAIPGVSPHLPASLDELRTRFIYAPSMSLTGFSVDEAISQSIPANASASVRFGLVPRQDPQRCFDLVANYLRAQVPEIEVKLVRTMHPAYSPVDTPFAQATIRAAETAFGAKPVIYDVMTGAGPGAYFLEHLGAPIISPTGTLRPDGNMHGYNEHGSIDDYLQHIQFTLELLRELDASGFSK